MSERSFASSSSSRITRQHTSARHSAQQQHPTSAAHSAHQVLQQQKAISEGFTTPTHPIKGFEALSKASDFDARFPQTTSNYQNKLHQQRLVELRQRLEETRKDNWRYPSIDSLLNGLEHPRH